MRLQYREVMYPKLYATLPAAFRRKHPRQSYSEFFEFAKDPAFRGHVDFCPQMDDERQMRVRAKSAMHCAKLCTLFNTLHLLCSAAASQVALEG